MDETRYSSDDAASKTEISAIITCYFEEKSIDEFHDRLTRTLIATGRSYEIIYVNDGSTDATFEHLKAIYLRDRNVSVVADLFKNSGQGNAIMAGILEARGEIYLFLDSDLQLMPEELPLLLEEYDKGYDVVSGFRKNRKDSWSRIIPSKIANMIMRRISKSDFRDFGCTFKLFNARLVRGFNPNPYMMFRHVDIIAQSDRRLEVPVTHLPRKYGRSGWTFGKLWNFNMENLVLLSQRPFQYLGALCLLLALLFMLRISLSPFLSFTLLDAVTNGLLLNALTVVFLALLGAAAMIGEFSIRSYEKLHQKPHFIVREIYRRADKDAPGRPRTVR